MLDYYTGGIQSLFPELAEKDKLASTYQLSDHLPLWGQINTDIDGFVLEQISKGYRERVK